MACIGFLKSKVIEPFFPNQTDKKHTYKKIPQKKETEFILIKIWY